MRIHLALLSQALLVLLLIPSASEAEERRYQAEFERSAHVYVGTSPGTDLLDCRRLYLEFELLGDLPPGQRDQITNVLLKHLSRPSSYSVTGDEPPQVSNTPAEGTPEPHFMVTGVETECLNPQMGGRRWVVKLLGHMRQTRGKIRIAQPDPTPLGTGRDAPVVVWELHARGASSGGEAVVGYELRPAAGVAREPFKLSAGVDSAKGTPALRADGSGVLRGKASGASISTLSLSAYIPLPGTTPEDVEETPGASTRAASKEVSDSAELAFSRVRYQKGGQLTSVGVKARATDTFAGKEVVGYYQPLMGWFEEARGFYAAELETGWRDGNAEWKDLATRAPDRGNAVARLGAVVEWAPLIGGVNRNLARGLRFYVRGRGWVDAFKNSEGDRLLRFCPYVDTELFLNFSKDWRVYARGEWGSLPPDLSLRVSRVSLGVGEAF